MSTTVTDWHPRATYIWTTKEIQSWYDMYGTSCWYLGKLYQPKTKKLVSNRYEVTFVEKK